MSQVVFPLYYFDNIKGVSMDCLDVIALSNIVYNTLENSYRHFTERCAQSVANSISSE